MVANLPVLAFLKHTRYCGQYITRNECLCVVHDEISNVVAGSVASNHNDAAAFNAFKVIGTANQRNSVSTSNSGAERDKAGFHNVTLAKESGRVVALSIVEARWVVFDQEADTVTTANVVATTNAVGKFSVDGTVDDETRRVIIVLNAGVSVDGNGRCGKGRAVNSRSAALALALGGGSSIGLAGFADNCLKSNTATLMVSGKSKAPRQ